MPFPHLCLMQTQLYISYAHRRLTRNFVHHSTNYRVTILLDFIESIALLCGSSYLLRGTTVEIFSAFRNICMGP